MNEEFFLALKLMAEENQISLDALAQIIEDGISKAIKKDNPRCDNVRVEINPESGVFEMGLLRTVVDDEPLDYDNEINIDTARTIDPDCYVGGMCLIPIPPATFGRVAVQNAKQQIKHELKAHERERIIEQFKDKLYECVTAKVEKIEARTGNAVLKFDKSEVYLMRSEQIPGEVLMPGDLIKVYVVGIVNPEKKPALKISRTHKELVKRLFENEVPEIAEGVVEVKGISRVAGSRSKIAVRSNDKNVDAIGACIGPQKSRISAIVNELDGEKIDIIPYSDDPAEYIAKALAPAQVLKVILLENSETKACRVVVPTNQLSLAIGNKGQNARLAAGLTGYKIDIVSQVQEKEIEAKEKADALAAMNETEEDLFVEEPQEQNAEAVDEADVIIDETDDKVIDEDTENGEV